jgi:hypothetical protein
MLMPAGGINRRAEGFLLRCSLLQRSVFLPDSPPTAHARQADCAGYTAPEQANIA